RYRAEHCAVDEAQLEDRAGERLLPTHALDEHPGQQVEHDDAHRHDRGELGRVLVFVRKHLEKDTLPAAFLASFRGTRFAGATNRFSLGITLIAKELSS